jgi:hypothetical protein
MTTLTVTKIEDDFVATDKFGVEFFKASSLREVNELVLENGYIFDGESFIKYDSEEEIESSKMYKIEDDRGFTLSYEGEVLASLEDLGNDLGCGADPYLSPVEIKEGVFQYSCQLLNNDGELYLKTGEYIKIK